MIAPFPANDATSSQGSSRSLFSIRCWLRASFSARWSACYHHSAAAS